MFALDALVAWGALAFVASLDATLVHADGSREAVQEVRRDSKGRWIAVIEGRTTSVVPGEVVVVVEPDGKEHVTIPPLVEAPAPPEAAALLASLCDPENEGWLLRTATELAKHPTRGVLDALVKLTTDKKKETRVRAVVALARLRTKESVTAAATAVLAEKDAAARREAASTLHSVSEIFRRCDTEQQVAAGLADKDAVVRVVFATLAPRELEAAKAVLRADGLKHSDHHVRESAALELGRRGDAAGESLLITLLGRDRMPGVTPDEALEMRLLCAQHVEICAILGQLATTPARAALKKATVSKHEVVRKAAEKAIAELPAQ